MLLLLLLSFRVAVYADRGVWDDGKTAIIQMLRYYNEQVDTISASQINSSPLSSYDVLVIPGGWAVNYRRSLSFTGLQNIRNFISGGGVYVGICAGAYFAADSIVWNGRVYDYPLDIFQGYAIGAIDSIASWPGYAMTHITLKDSWRDPSADSTQYVLYYGGPYFESYGTTFDTAGMYDGINEPGIIVFTYGNGKVILSGVHPEIEEDSDRDSTTFAYELPDSGSDWPWFMYIIQEALNRVSIDENFYSMSPRDRRQVLFVDKKSLLKYTGEGKIYNLSGRRVSKENLLDGIYLLYKNGRFTPIAIFK